MGNMLSEKAEHRLDELCAVYSNENDRMCVFTGAGVSLIKTSKYIAPDWWGLLKDVYSLLCVSQEWNRKYSSFEDLKREYSDPWKMADFLMEYIDSTEFGVIICRVLNERVTKDVIYKRLPRAYLAKAKTLNATIAFCSQIRAKREHQCLKPNDRILAVITINYDCFLEAGATTKYQSFPFKPIASKDYEPCESQLPVFHIHGYAPYGYLFEVRKESLRCIEQEGVPDKVLKPLRALVDKDAMKGDEFLKNLRKQLDKDEIADFKSYRRTILDATKVIRYPKHDLVMSTNSYKAAYQEDSDPGFAAWTFNGYLSTTPTLFVGVSFNDRLLIKKLESLSGRDYPKHFALIKQADSAEVRQRLSRTNVELISYQDHKSLKFVFDARQKLGNRKDGIPSLETITGLNY
jgi:hypothetical protein